MLHVISCPNRVMAGGHFRAFYSSHFDTMPAMGSVFGLGNCTELIWARGNSLSVANSASKRPWANPFAYKARQEPDIAIHAVPLNMAMELRVGMRLTADRCSTRERHL
jgi:hypothetical protein